MANEQEKNQMIAAVARELHLLDVAHLNKVRAVIQQFKYQEQQKAMQALKAEPAASAAGSGAPSGAERRGCQRLKVNLPVKYAVVGGEEEIRQGNTIDISGGGARMTLFSQYQIEPGFILEVDIRMPDQPRPITTRAKVAWVKACKDPKGNDGYESGLSFIDILSSDKESIEKFVAERLNGSSPQNG